MWAQTAKLQEDWQLGSKGVDSAFPDGEAAVQVLPALTAATQGEAIIPQIDSSLLKPFSKNTRERNYLLQKPFFPTRENSL